MSLSRTVRFYTLRFKRLQGSNRSLALGAAIGSAVGATPTLPLHNVLILGFTLLFRVNPIAGIITANIVSNPLTFVPQYFLAWKIGDFFLPGRLTWEKIKSVLALIKTEGIMDSLDTVRAMGLDAILVMMVGGLVLAIPAGVLTYIIVFRFFARLQEKRRQKHLLNRREE
ncbi:MAG: DUF2062 domain-containing protein [Desulfobulbaceae bacterium]|jgi:hypothetical protein|nr:DUF2062 domain-containing protein [Desulfobulbaceae bacterium]